VGSQKRAISIDPKNPIVGISPGAKTKSLENIVERTAENRNIQETEIRRERII